MHPPAVNRPGAARSLRARLLSGVLAAALASLSSEAPIARADSAEQRDPQPAPPVSAPLPSNEAESQDSTTLQFRSCAELTSKVMVKIDGGGPTENVPECPDCKDLLAPNRLEPIDCPGCLHARDPGFLYLNPAVLDQLRSYLRVWVRLDAIAKVGQRSSTSPSSVDSSSEFDELGMGPIQLGALRVSAHPGVDEKYKKLSGRCADITSLLQSWPDGTGIELQSDSVLPEELSFVVDDGTGLYAVVELNGLITDSGASPHESSAASETFDTSNSTSSPAAANSAPASIPLALSGSASPASTSQKSTPSTLPAKPTIQPLSR